MSFAGPSASPWRDSPRLRWLTVFGALCIGLGLVGMPWQNAADRAPPVGSASFDRDRVAAPVTTAAAPPSNRGAGGNPSPSPSPSPSPGDALPSPPATPAAPTQPPTAAAPVDRPRLPSGQTYSAVTWFSSDMQPIAISGGGLTASASRGGTHTVVANRGVSEGRHYLELRLSIPAGEGGPSTWSGVGVVPISSLSHGRVVMPMLSSGSVLAVSTGRGQRFNDGDIVMMAIDLDQKLAFWGLNGEWMNGVPGAQGGASLQGQTGDLWMPFANITASQRDRTPPEGGERWIANFGASAFRYQMPRGFDSYGSAAASGHRGGTPPSASGQAAAPGNANQAPSPHVQAMPPAPVAPDILMGKRLQDQVVVQGQTIPLPAGTWTVLAHFRDPGLGLAQGDAVVLGRIEGNKLAGLVAVNATRLSGGATPRPFEACNRADYAFRKVDTYDAQGEQRCWWINHAVSVWQSQPIFQAARTELSRLGVSPPQVLMNVGLRRADANGMATTFYYFDPASEGIASASTTWAESEWQRSRLDADPARKAYVQKLERWGEGWSQIYFKSR